MGKLELRSFLASSVAVCAAAVATPALAQTKSFHVPAQPASTGIPELARQADIQILVSESAVRGRTTRSVRGRMSAEAALRALIDGTGLRVATSDGRTVTLTAVAAQAEPSGEAPAGSAAASDGSADIIVTGSRIRRDVADTLEPTTIISAEYLNVRGITNIADALNEQPGFGVPQNAQGGQNPYGVSQNFVNKFGLGTPRTLTIVNGRRFVSTNAPVVIGNPSGLQVDLNVIPSLMVERIENVAIGGAPIYGSDAIAGTINVILKKNYEGIEAQVQNGVSDQGDNFRTNLSAIAGFKFGPGGRGHVLVGGSYDRSEGFRGIDRAIIRAAYSFQTNPSAATVGTQFPGRSPATDGRVNGSVPFNGSAADGIPNTVLIANTRLFTDSNAGLILPINSVSGIRNGNVAGFGADGSARLQFDSNGNIVPYNQGSPFGTAYASGGDGFNLNDANPAENDLTRYSVNVVADYELTDSLRTFFEGTYYYGVGQTAIDQPVYNSPRFSGANGALTFNIADPRLSEQARATLRSYGVTNFLLSRNFFDIFETPGSSTTRVYRVVGGLSGKFGLLGKKFEYEASLNFGRTDGTFHPNQINQQKFVNAINNCNPTPIVNAAPGGLVPVADPACVALNPFGPGRLDPRALAYINYRATARSAIEQDVYNINIGSSELFSLWSGGVGFNIGYEHRREYAEFRPDPFQTAALGRSAAVVSTAGGYNTEEVFGEIIVPLVSPDNHIPLVKNLVVEGRARHVGNSINGGFWAYTYGGRYSPIKDIEFRGNYTRSLRSPSIVEMFAPRSSVSIQFPDPCDIVNISGGSNPAVRQRNCAAFYSSYGIDPATFTSLARTTGVPGIVGGNPDLKNEEARSYTFGVVLRPSFAPRFQATIDWNRIMLTGNIATLGATNIAEGCYDDPNFNLSDPDAGNAFCTLFTRIRSSNANTNGQIVSDPANPGIRTTTVNGSFREFKGLSANASYLLPLDGIGIDGRLSLSGAFFYLDTLRSSNNGITIDPQAGEVGNPKYSGQLNLGFIGNGGAGINVQANYTGSARYDMLFNSDSRDILKLDDQWLFNLGLSQRINGRATVRLAVSNILNTTPPFPYDGVAAYDLLGRRYSLAVNVKF